MVLTLGCIGRQHSKHFSVGLRGLGRHIAEHAITILELPAIGICSWRREGLVEEWQFEMNCLPYNLDIININAPTLAATRSAEFFAGSAQKIDLRPPAFS